MSRFLFIRINIKVNKMILIPKDNKSIKENAIKCDYYEIFENI